MKNLFHKLETYVRKSRYINNSQTFKEVKQRNLIKQRSNIAGMNNFDIVQQKYAELKLRHIHNIEMK